MAIVLNKSAAMISATTTTVWEKPDASGRQKIKKVGKHYNFAPGALVNVSSDDLKELKEVPLIDRSFENGNLVMGSEAKKIAEADKKKIAGDEKEKEKE